MVTSTVLATAKPSQPSSPRQVGNDAGRARRLLGLVPRVPALTWGRDEMHTGEMWNSNSLTAWLLARGGHLTDAIRAPAHGRAPGWHAGLTVASEQAGRRRTRLSPPPRQRLGMNDQEVPALSTPGGART
jgi:hypothetical protein